MSMPSLLCSRTAGLLLGLVLTALATAGEAAPRRGRGRELTLAVERIGRAAVSAQAPARASFEPTLSYYVNHREAVAISLSTPLPPCARVYPLVRREGASAWEVQQPAVGPGGRNAAGVWLAEVRFGNPSETGTRFDLLTIATPGPMRPGAIPDGLRRASTLAESAMVRVERRRGRSFVGVSSIGGLPVYGDREVEVQDMATVAVVARDIPPQARVGVVVHPATTDRRWVMPDLSGNGTGEITTYFGTGEPGDDFFRYTVSAFVAWVDDMPPPAVGIPPQQWESYQERFLAESRIVRVIRWEGELRIKAVGSLMVVPNRILLVQSQEDVHGAVHRKLQAGERIWLLCVPRRGDPWVAGWTSRLRPSGQWVVNAAALWGDKQPSRFDLVAVLSANDPTRVDPPAALRTWLHGEERPHHSVRVQVQPPPDADGDAPAPARGRRP